MYPYKARARTFVPAVRRWSREGVILGAVLVAANLFGLAVQAQSQDRDPTTYEVYGGGSYSRAFATTNIDAYGWEASLTQYPYQSRRWVGGTVEGSGLFDTRKETVPALTLSDSTYSMMGGPAFSAPSARGFKPFAHALVGAVIAKTNVTGTDADAFRSTLGTTRTALAWALDGGVDFPMAPRWWARGQAGWLTYKENLSDRVNDLRVSAGIVLKF
jgi:hypothetical protein